MVINLSKNENIIEKIKSLEILSRAEDYNLTRIILKTLTKKEMEELKEKNYTHEILVTIRDHEVFSMKTCGIKDSLLIYDILNILFSNIETYYELKVL